MSSKQTAVEWLVEKLNQCEPWYSGLDNELAEHINKLINEAREMERLQIETAYERGLNFPWTLCSNTVDLQEKAKQYFVGNHGSGE